MSFLVRFCPECENRSVARRPSKISTFWVSLQLLYLIYVPLLQDAHSATSNWCYSDTVNTGACVDCVSDKLVESGRQISYPFPGLPNAEQPLEWKVTASEIGST